MKKSIITSALVAALAFTPVLPAAASVMENPLSLAVSDKGFDVNSLSSKPGVRVVAINKEMLSGMAKTMGILGSNEAKTMLKVAENLDKVVAAILPEGDTKIFNETKQAVAADDSYEEGTTIESKKEGATATVFAKTADGRIKEVVAFVTAQTPSFSGSKTERKAIIQVFGNFTQDDIETLMEFAGGI